MQTILQNILTSFNSGSTTGARTGGWTLTRLSKTWAPTFLGWLATALLVLLWLSPGIEAIAQTQNGGQNNYLYARKLFDEGYFDLAAEQLERVLRDNPDLANVDEIYFQLGESYLNAGNSKKARAAFLRLAFEYPESPMASEALFYNAQALETMGQLFEAAHAYQRLQQFYPKAPVATESLIKALNIFRSIHDSVQAEIICDRIIEKYSQSDAADGARLYKADLIFQRGDFELTKLILERVAQRAFQDSIRARAYFKLGILLKETWEFQAAAEMFQQAIKAGQAIDIEATARLELSALQSFRGIPDEALLTLEPILETEPNAHFQSALIKAGDAYYQKKNYQKAGAYYLRAKTPESLLKYAWTSERTGALEQALATYRQLAKHPGPLSKSALLRATQLAISLQDLKLATELWSQIESDSSAIIPDGVTVLEIARIKAANYEAFQPEEILALRTLLDQVQEYNPYADDLTYLAARMAERKENYALARELYTLLTRPSSWLASPLADSALSSLDFLQRCRIQSGDLIQKMATLSSTPQGIIGTINWSMNWGNFYLEDFKDPVKAIDQYDFVLADSTVTSEQRRAALNKSGEAYLRLVEIAIREDDAVALSMFADSAASRLDQMTRDFPDSDQTHQLKLNTLSLRFAVSPTDTANLRSCLEEIKQSGSGVGRPGLDPVWLGEILYSIATTDLINDLEDDDLYQLARVTAETNLEEREQARLQYFSLRFLETSEARALEQDTTLGLFPLMVQLATEISQKYGQTPAGAKSLRWLFEQDSLPPDQRLTNLNRFRQLYPYLIEPVDYYRNLSSLLDATGRGYAAYLAGERADSIAAWGQPQIDILQIPDERSTYQRARILFHSDSLEHAALEFRRLLNIDPVGDYAASSLLALAEIFTRGGDFAMSVAYLDTLETRFPYSAAAATGEHLRPRLEFLLGHYEQSRTRYLNLISQTEAADSLFLFRIRETVCLYRLDKLEEARKSARQVYKDFDNRDDLDRFKALFYLEKGLSLDRIRQHEEARQQYQTIAREYNLTEWVDDAAFSTGLSFTAENKFEEAVTELQTFTENFPQSPLRPDAWVTLGQAQIRLNKFSEASLALKQAWQDSSARMVWQPAFKLLIQLYREMRFFDAAIKLTREYLDRFPYALDGLMRRMEIGQFYLEIGDWDEAIRQYRPLLQFADAEEEAEIQFYIGEATQRKGEFRSAILEFLKVPVLGRKTKLDWGVTALYQAGGCYEKLGDYEGAARMYREIIKQTGATSNFGRAAQKQLDQLIAKGLVQ